MSLNKCEHNFSNLNQEFVPWQLQEKGLTAVEYEVLY